MDEKPEDYLKNSTHAAYQVIQAILERGSEQIYENHVSTKSVPFAIDATISVLFSMAEMQYIRCDSKEPESWTQDTEPVPCGIDNWARNAVPVHIKVKIPQPEATLNITQPDAKSVKSYSSRRSMMNRPQKAGKSASKLKETTPIEEGIIPVPIHQDKSEINEIEEDLRYRKEKELQRKKQESERLKKIKDEEIEKEKKMQKEAEDIKKKNFTYDHKGKIIYVNPVRYDLAPEAFLDVKYASQEPVVEEKKQGIKKKPSREFVQIKRLKTAPVQEKEWVKNITSVQPPLIEIIKLSAGVTFIEGARSKCNPEGQDSYKTLSRKQYNELYQPKQEPLNSQTFLVPEKKSSSVSSMDSYKKSPEGKKDIFDIIPDYDEAQPIAETRQKVGASVSPLRYHGKVIQYGGPVNLDISAGPTEKFNAEIMNNKNWGLNPPLQEPRVIERIPKKPSVKELRELYGNIVKKPKDKPFITPGELWDANAKKIRRPRDRPNIERVEKKTRMPPPPYGFTMINALPEINGLNVSVSGKSMNKSEIIK